MKNPPSYLVLPGGRRVRAEQVPEPEPEPVKKKRKPKAKPKAEDGTLG